MPEEQSDIEQLQEIIAELPDAEGFTPSRRKHSLTQGDVMLIYRIAKIATVQHVCPFGNGEPETLKTVARSINKTQKIASGFIILSIVTTVFSGIWYALSHVLTEWVHRGGALPK